MQSQAGSVYEGRELSKFVQYVNTNFGGKSAIML